MTDQKLSLAASLLITGVLVMAFTSGIIVVLPKLDQYLKLKAFDDCAKATSYAFEAVREGTESKDTTKSTEPIKQFYIACIADKGYTTELTGK